MVHMHLELGIRVLECTSVDLAPNGLSVYRLLCLEAGLDATHATGYFTNNPPWRSSELSHIGHGADGGVDCPSVALEDTEERRHENTPLGQCEAEDRARIGQDHGLPPAPLNFAGCC
jgi:hypothetical protein